MDVSILRVGRYQYGSESVVITPTILKAMAANSKMPMPVIVRHDQDLVTGEIESLRVSDDGTELLGKVSQLLVVPAFTLGPPELVEVSVTGCPMIVPEPL